MSQKFQILFVCSGNSCRSPMAEGLLKKRLYPEYLDKLNVISAGTLGIVNSPATPLAIKVCKEKGVDIANHRSRALTKEVLEQSDLVLVMSDYHKEFIRNNFPELIDKVFLLTEFDQSDSDNEQNFLSIPDPIGENLSFYRKVINQIDTELSRIIPRLKQDIEKKLDEHSDEK